jgi:hypothetical protein
MASFRIVHGISVFILVWWFTMCMHRILRSATTTRHTLNVPRMAHDHLPGNKNILVTFIIPSTLPRVTLNRTLSSLLQQTAPHWRAMVGLDLVTMGRQEILDYHTPDNVRERAFHFTHADPRTSFVPISTDHNFRGRQRHHGPGAVRNRLIDEHTKRRTTALPDSVYEQEWIAFVEDDDTLSLYFVEYLTAMARQDTVADIIIFRMQANGMQDTIPPRQLLANATDRAGRIPTGSGSPEDADAYWLGIGGIGISFAVRRTLFASQHESSLSQIWFTPHPSEAFFLVKTAQDAHAHVRLSTCNFYNIRRDPAPRAAHVGAVDGSTMMSMKPQCGLEDKRIIVSERKPVSL